MPVERGTNRVGSGIFGAAALALAAIGVLNAQRIEGPQESFKGVPWIGQPPVTITVAELMDRESRATPISPRVPEPRGYTLTTQRELSGAPAVSQWSGDSGAAAVSASPSVAFNVSTNWLGPRFAESGVFPPDTSGAVGPTQVLITTNGRFKIYDKGGVLGGFDVSDQTFWSSVLTTTVGTTVQGPRVRYDRLSGRWFITETDVPPCRCANRILIAVSSGPTITSSSSFTLYFFQHDTVGPTPNPDSNGFAASASLGVDINALYIGVNEFSASGQQFINTSGYVVNKSALIAGGPPVVTAFRQLLNPATFEGPFSPQGVDNDDPLATEGYFAGVNAAAFSQLVVRRVTSPGGSPAISGSLLVTVPVTVNPIAQVALGSTLPLDALDTRLFAAMIKKNALTGVSSLWTAHNIGVNASGVGSIAADRNAGRWYQLDNLTTTPALTQAGTVFDPAGSNPNGYWINAIAANGQGHAAIGQSYASAVTPPSWAVFSRSAGDPAGQMGNGMGALGVAGYNLQTPAPGVVRQRWGDYSQTVVDPSDNMTLWTFQEYADAVNSWGVRAIKLTAPGPATPVSASPSFVPRAPAISVIVTGTSVLDSGFFDPGAAFPNRIQASVSGCVVNSVTFVNPTTVILNLSTVGVSPGAKNITITNPDGQAMTGIGLLTVSALAPAGDFDGDAKSDVTVFRPSTGNWYVLKSSTNYTTSMSFAWGLSTDTPVPGDYDGDGKIDPAIYRPSTGLWAYLKSSTNYTTSASVSWGLSTDLPVPGDFDGDGKIDPTIYRPSTGLWAYLKSSTSYTTSVMVTWGLSTDLPVQGDYDGDGKADPAIFRPSTGLWAYLKSSTSYTTSFAVSWGLSTDVAVPGDYDGDGRIDPAVYRPSTGLWAILRSGTSYTSSFTVMWGLGTDNPVPADYDGDGKFDPAVFRPSTGLWTYLKSSTNYTTSAGVSWGLSTDVPINKRP